MSKSRWVGPEEGHLSLTCGVHTLTHTHMYTCAHMIIMRGGRGRKGAKEKEHKTGQAGVKSTLDGWRAP